MPSAKTVRPSPTDLSRPGSSKRIRLSHTLPSCTKKKQTIKSTMTCLQPTELVILAPATAATCKVPKFLRSLYAILQTEDPHIISWVQNQALTPNCVTAFHILEMARFECEILPKYFKHQKFASFQRQLNNFGFRKWTKTQSSGVCTFSHNCFPPDFSRGKGSKLSIRDQWRQKSTHVIPSIISGFNRQSMKRRSNDKEKSKEEETVSSSSVCRRSMNVQVSHCDDVMDKNDVLPLVEMYQSPNFNATMESKTFRHSQCHQPPLKKWARSNLAMKHDTSDSLACGLEAFCDDAFKQFTLPLLQPHRLVVATGTKRKMTAPALSTPAVSNHNDLESARTSSGFRLSLPPMLNNNSSTSTTFADLSLSNNGLKPFDLKHNEAQALPFPSIGSQYSRNNGAADAAALQGAFLEPWMWDAQTSSSNLELGSFPLEFDCKNDFDCKAEFDWQEGSSATNYEDISSTARSIGILKKEPSYQQDGGASFPNAEEVGLDILLFVE
ncbi:unnamed protein product [Peronospora belbahrii]|uniref:HSF-type DNA-binding domain-containing protein n=1 Tax=Peronospora belbahrii TaxID=622444 RepID=A0AAU9L2L1_9STRA|nr:unnamed protein product [Peronospora belbahrii]CAH0516960.1 unnamed protein product [Peronospora belbahrii]